MTEPSKTTYARLKADKNASLVTVRAGDVRHIINLVDRADEAGAFNDDCYEGLDRRDLMIIGFLRAEVIEAGESFHPRPTA